MLQPLSIVIDLQGGLVHAVNCSDDRAVVTVVDWDQDAAPPGRCLVADRPGLYRRSESIPGGRRRRVPRDPSANGSGAHRPGLVPKDWIAP